MHPFINEINKMVASPQNQLQPVLMQNCVYHRWKQNEESTLKENGNSEFCCDLFKEFAKLVPAEFIFLTHFKIKILISYADKADLDS